MSHTLKCEVAFKSPDDITATCRELKLPVPVRGKVTLYDGKTLEDAFSVQLPGWRHPVAIDAKTGEAFYDNYGGSWGHQKELDRLKQHYAANVATRTAVRQGHRVQRVIAANGSIRLQISAQ